MQPELPKIDPAEVESLVQDLAVFGAHSGTGVCRLVYAAEWQSAQDQVARWAGAAGLDARFDAVGNLWARAEGRSGGKAIVTGSHIDSQVAGGQYDGALGVIAGFLAISKLVQTFGPPRRPLELVSLCEEEGSRFPTASFWGSRAIVGRTTPEDCNTVTEAGGRSIGQAMQDVGLDPAQVVAARRDDIAAFLELHIEQGPVLEDADVPVAIVEGITHIRQTEFTLTGVSNHAGAFPMDLRSDPMAGFAEIAAALVQRAEKQGRPAVTTIGRCNVVPNAGAIIPDRVTFTVDARHPDEAAAQAMYAAHDVLINEVALRRGLHVSRRILIDLAACPSDDGLVAALEKSAARAGIKTLRMASGAGHDSQQMAEICPIAMVFVRSKEGRSHTPQEYSSPEDMAQGVEVLMGALYDLAYRETDAF